MKSLLDYIDKNFIGNQEDSMKVRRIMAPQDLDREAVWNSVHDRWSRNAKHRLQIVEAENMDDTKWEKGDTAVYKGEEVTIEIPQGPNNTIGIMVEGQVRMVLKDSLTEGVMGGMQPLGPINRMMQLAGLSVPTVIETNVETDNAEVIEEADSTNMFNQLMKANLAGEYRNNPAAARMATIGQILIGLNTLVSAMKTKNEIPANMAPKLDAAVGLGAFILQTATKMTKQ